MRSKKKENVVILPNREECPAGKIKDVTKLLNLVSAEYGIAEDIQYFNLVKQKNKYLLKLIFIPNIVEDLHSINAKKFVAFELITSEIGCAIQTDEDLNKTASTILDLINNNDINCRETVRAKLSAIIDIPGQLDHIVDQLLTDSKYNSFKYSVLNNNKNTCLLCINMSGIFIRSLEQPFDVQDSLVWSDMNHVSCKNKKIIIHRKNETNTEIYCLNKKTATLAQQHLNKYLEFMGEKVIAETTSWLGRISLRIRKSFTRHGDTSTLKHPTTCSISDKPTSSLSIQHKYTAPSTIPESSYISEDVMENPTSIIEPSLKTNSTYDVSLGSDNSYRPTITSLSNDELSNNNNNNNGDKISSFQKLPYQIVDDHLSLKTNSTYEVSVDSRQMIKPMTIDNESVNCIGSISSFTPNSDKTSPQLQLTTKKDITLPSMTRSVNNEYIKKGNNEEILIQQTTMSMETSDPQYVTLINDDKNKLPIIPIIHKYNEHHVQAIPIQILSHQPIVPIQPPHGISKESPRKLLPEPPIRTVTDQSYKTMIVPEPPIRTTSDQSNITNRQDSLEKTTKITSTSLPPLSSIISPTIVQTIARPVVVIPEINKNKLTMTIEPIKEEEISLQCTDSIIEPLVDNLIIGQQHYANEMVTSSSSSSTLLNNATITNVALPIDIIHHSSTINTNTNTINITTNTINTTPNTNTINTTTTTMISPLKNQSTICDDIPINISQYPINIIDSGQIKSQDINLSEIIENPKSDRPENLKIEEVMTDINMEIAKTESKLPVSRQRSIPSPKIQRINRSNTAKDLPSPKEEIGSLIPMKMNLSSSDKENYQNDKDKQRDDDDDQEIKSTTDKPVANFSRFEGQECKVDSKTTFTSVSTVGDNIIKKSTQTEISSVKSTGIPTPKQYKSTTTITTTTKKPVDVSKSPINNTTKIPTGIPRMSSK